MTNLLHIISSKIMIVFTTVMVSITSILPWSGPKTIKLVDTPTSQPTEIIVEVSTPSATMTPKVTPRIENRVQITSGVTPTPTINEIKASGHSQITEVQKQRVDPSVGIEQCKVTSKEKRKEEEKKVYDDYNASEPKISQLATTQNNGETEAVALKYGLITEKDVVRSADVFMELVNQGYPQETAQSMATSMHNSYSTYLRSLHDWAVNELNKWKSVLKDKFDTYESQVYQRCLSTL